MIISWIITGIIAVSLAWLVYHAVAKYREAEGTVWQRLLAGFKDSATILAAAATWIGGSTIDIVDRIATTFNQQELVDLVTARVPVKYVGFGLMAIGAIFFIARLRSLVK